MALAFSSIMALAAPSSEQPSATTKDPQKKKGTTIRQYWILIEFLYLD